MKSIESAVELSEKEVSIKTYHCTILQSLMLRSLTFQSIKCEGYITVTNKRVVLHTHSDSATGTSRMVSEVPIEMVSGISSYIGSGYSVWKMIAVVFLGLLLLNNISSIVKTDYAGNSGINPVALFISIFIGFVIYYLAQTIKMTIFNLQVYSSGAAGVAIALSSGAAGLLGLTGQNAVKALTANPAQDAEKLVRELGAIVLDVKTLGDMAIQKWQEKRELP